jgi:SsrA-binding protein
MAKSKAPFLIENKKARHNYAIDETLESGISLTGSEVKALRMKLGSLLEAYVVFKNDEVFLQNAHIPEYSNGGYANHSPLRLRKLLLNRDEIDRLYSQTKEKNDVVVPIKFYLKNGKIKLLLGVGKSKNKGDKRKSLREKEDLKQIKKHL